MLSAKWVNWRVAVVYAEIFRCRYAGLHSQTRCQNQNKTDLKIIGYLLECSMQLSLHLKDFIHREYIKMGVLQTLSLRASTSLLLAYMLGCIPCMRKSSEKQRAQIND